MQQPTCDRFLATSFYSKIDPPSDHYTRPVKTETLNIIMMELSPLTSNNTL